MKTIRRQFSDCTCREHPRRHFKHDAVYAVRLDYDIYRCIAARFHKQISKIDPHVVHSARRRKVVRPPGALRWLAVNDDCRRTEVKKKRQREETRLDLNPGPRLLCSHILCDQKSNSGLRTRRGARFGSGFLWFPAQHRLARRGRFIEPADAC